MKIVVDGNDGTGKTTLVQKLLLRGFEVSDRGLPTKMTDDESVIVSKNSDVVYIILDASVSVCQMRLRRAGKDLNEKYHTVEDLTHYRIKFLKVAKKLEEAGNRCLIINTSDLNEKEVLNRFLIFLHFISSGSEHCSEL